MKNQLLLYLVTVVLFVSPLAAEEKTKIVFISGKPSHGVMSHEHRAGNIILAKRLNASGLGINAHVLPEDGYPKDPSVLEDADTIVIFCTGHGGHVLNPNLEAFDALMKKGVGVVMIHWATEAVAGDPGNKFLEWMGGFCDLNWSVNPHWTASFKKVDHEIWNGVKPFSVNDEWYYHMRFVKDMKGVTPILSDLPGAETLRRPDGPRSGNPHVRRAVANGESQHVAWAYERPGGKGRGFGFTGGHNHKSWQNDGFRTIILNAILWTAGRQVPSTGVVSDSPSDEEIGANLDDKRRRARNGDTQPGSFKPINGKPIPPQLSFQELRKQQIRKVDAGVSIDLLARTLPSISSPDVQASLLRGMLKGLSGKRNVEAPPSWHNSRDKLIASDNDEVKRLAIELSQIFGDQSATNVAIGIVNNVSASSDDRKNALRSLVNQQDPEIVPVLRNLLNDEDLRVDAIRAFGVIEDKFAPQLLIKRFASADFQTRRATVETLASRKYYASRLVEAIDNNSIPKSEIPVYIARSLKSLLGSQFTDVFGDIEELSSDKSALINKYRNLLSEERLVKADASQGRALYAAVCAACHQMYGEGGRIGPDLTGSNRANIDYILLNMIDPSGDIPDAYKQVTIHTKSGQVLIGTLVEEDDQKLTLNTVAQKVTVSKNDIKTRDVSNLSMMPEGLLSALNNNQVLDLVKYLQTKSQVNLPK